MNELSLFTGAGGGVLGTHHLLGWRTIGYVEWDDYCQQVIAARIRDGYLDAAPIFGDVREFVQSGAAAQYRGFADVVTAGFPCQPFSLAGKQLGEDDPRNMWPATLDTIRLVRPRYALLENVRGIVSNGYIKTVLGDLAESGYDCRWRILSAQEVGAPHKRDRLWIAAVDNTLGFGWDTQRHHHGEHDGDQFSPTSEHAETVAHAKNGVGNDLSPKKSGEHREHVEARGCGRHAGGFRWQTEPDVGRVADGVAFRVDRIKALGNGQVPLVAATAWKLLTGEVTQP